MKDLIEYSVEGVDSSPPTNSLCPNCGTLFPYRSNKTFCSSRCRYTKAKRIERRVNPVNAANSRDKARAQLEKYDLAMRMAERLYTMPPNERLGYLEAIIRLARGGHSPLVRDILTTPQLLQPDPTKGFLFHRKAPGVYFTISQAANRYCLWSAWAAPVGRVVKGLVPEPPTGECFEDGTIDIGDEAYQRRRQKIDKVKAKSVDTLNRGKPMGRPNVHPWYGLGDLYPYPVRQTAPTEELR